MQFPELLADRVCALECGPDKPCYVDTCCARRQSVAEPSSHVNIAGIRRSSKRIPSWLDLHTSDTRHDPQFGDNIRTFTRQKTTKGQSDDAEFRANGVVTASDTQV